MSHEAVLSYWFRTGGLETRRWFQSGTRHDREIRRRFGKVLERAERGELGWPDGPRAYLAEVIVLDQFSRHVHRGTPREFANDAAALRAARRGLRHLPRLNAVEQMFALMPYQHSESSAAQRRGVELLRRLLRAERVESEQKILRMALTHQIGHRDVVRRFGRFPKRNTTLRRRSTSSEARYLRAESRRKSKRPY